MQRTGVEAVLDSSAAEFLRVLRSAPSLDWSVEHIKANRAALKESHLNCFTRQPRNPVQTQYAQIVGPHGRIPISIKTPEDKNVTSTVAIYIHGGGWVSGDLETHSPVVDHLVSMSRSTIVSVDYQLSPEARFPVALEECHAVLNWASRRYAQKLTVIGDSAGGNLAAALCRLARDGDARIDRQVLICPVLDPANFDTASRKKFGGGDYLLSNAELRQLIDHYASDSADVGNPLFSPLRADRLDGLPSALIITAECDMLLDEGKAYADRLAAQGVAVRYQMFPGMMHDFAVFGDSIPLSYKALGLIAEALRN